MKVWTVFARSRKARIICFALAAALLMVSAVGLGRSGAAPTQETAAGQYEHRGRFDYTVYLKPSILYGDAVATEEKEEEEVPMLFFRNIIEDVTLSFSYSFESSQPVANVTNEFVLSIVAESPGLWQKEMIELEETHEGTVFTVDFPLNLVRLEGIADDIEEDIGIASGTAYFVIRAVVQTTADTAQGKTIEDEFSYELPVTLTSKQLELTGELGSSQDGSGEGIKYQGKGRFDYEINLEPNDLYETDVLKSEAPPATESPASPYALGPGLLYFPRLISSIQASFSYRLLCNRPITGQSQKVEVTITIENPGQWSKSLVVVPETSKAGSFTVSFPIDVAYFASVIDAIGQETGARGSSHNIIIQADVDTVASTDLGTISEAYTQTLSGKLEANALTFAQELSGSKSGYIGVPAAEASTGSRAPWIFGLVIALLALAYFAWCQMRLAAAPISAGQAEIARAGKKYRQVMVDVEDLPETKATETVIPLNSLDDLVRIADDLVKPVLHVAGIGRHTYCVIDSGVRYLHVIQI
jgi:hypothetical protein